MFSIGVGLPDGPSSGTTAPPDVQARLRSSHHRYQPKCGAASVARPRSSTPLRTHAAPAAAVLPGFPGTDGTLWTFFFEHKWALWTTAVDAGGNKGNVQRYDLVSGAWVPQGLVVLDALSPVYSISGRYESNAATGFVRRFIVYGTTDTKLYRYDRALAVGGVTTVATAAAGQHFRGVAMMPACR